MQTPHDQGDADDDGETTNHVGGAPLSHVLSGSPAPPAGKLPVKIRTTTEYITPTLAAKYLALNHPDNRAIRQKRVKEWVDALKGGQWVLTHQGIAFDVLGRLVDGQHRLTAIIMAGVGAPMMVARGLAIESFSVLDQGAFRNAADVLRLKTWHVAALRCLVGLERADHSYSQVLKTVDLEERLKLPGCGAIPHLAQLIHSARSTRRFITGPVLGALAYAHPVMPAFVEKFANQVCTGELLARNDPAYQLREWLSKNFSMKGKLGWDTMMATLHTFHHLIVTGTHKMEKFVPGEGGYRCITTQRRILEIPNTPSPQLVPAPSSSGMNPDPNYLDSANP